MVLAALVYIAVSNLEGGDGFEVALHGAAAFVWHLLACALVLVVTGFFLVRPRPWTASGSGFRGVFFVLNETYLIFFLTFWGACWYVSASLFGVVGARHGQILGQGLLWLSLVLIVGSGVVAVIVTAFLGRVQLWFFERSRVDPPGFLAGVQSPIEVVINRLTSIEMLVARDERAETEVDWCERYLKKIARPTLFQPVDILSLDSQISTRAIYPAALLLWSEQIRLNHLAGRRVECLIEGNEADTAARAWRTNLAGHLSEAVERARRNFEEVGEEIRETLPDEVDMAPLRNALVPEAALAARVLIYEAGVLTTQVVRSVIAFHEASRIPLFFIPASVLRRTGTISAGSRKGARSLVEPFRELQDVARAQSHYRWRRSKFLDDAEESLWQRSQDDFIVIDDSAWVGYPEAVTSYRQDGLDEAEPLGYIERFLILLSHPKIMLAGQARELMQRAARDEGVIGGVRRWYGQL